MVGALDGLRVGLGVVGLAVGCRVVPVALGAEGRGAGTALTDGFVRSVVGVVAVVEAATSVDAARLSAPNARSTMRRVRRVGILPCLLVGRLAMACAMHVTRLWRLDRATCSASGQVSHSVASVKVAQLAPHPSVRLPPRRHTNSLEISAAAACVPRGRTHPSGPSLPALPPSRGLASVTSFAAPSGAHVQFPLNRIDESRAQPTRAPPESIVIRPSLISVSRGQVLAFFSCFVLLGFPSSFVQSTRHAHASQLIAKHDARVRRRVHGVAALAQPAA